MKRSHLSLQWQPPVATNQTPTANSPTPVALPAKPTSPGAWISQIKGMQERRSCVSSDNEEQESPCIDILEVRARAEAQSCSIHKSQESGGVASGPSPTPSPVRKEPGRAPGKKPDRQDSCQPKPAVGSSWGLLVLALLAKGPLLAPSKPAPAEPTESASSSRSRS